MNEKKHKYRLSLTKLALTCLYIGVTGYGGPAIVGNMKQIFVDRKRWITEDEFVTGLSLSQLLPSAIGVNTIEYIGYQLRGSLGAIIAPICFIAPATVLMTILSAIYFSYGTTPIIKSLFAGLSAVVIALIINAGISMGKSAIKNVAGAVIAVTGFVIIEVFSLPIVQTWASNCAPPYRSIILSILHLPIPMVALVSGIAGYLVLRPGMNGSSNGDDLPRPTAKSGTFWLALSAAILLIAVILALTARTETTRLLLAILRVGSLTFGGGFMSIPLFQHESVVANHWLTHKQFLDGLALGQITPGPVLITANFIGYHQLGVIGALLGSIAIFTPGAVGMFVLAHQHDKVKHLLWLQSMVRGIVAGFMGVLLSVVIGLAMKSLLDWKRVCIAIVALYVILIAKKDPLWVILGGALLSIFIFK